MSDHRPNRLKRRLTSPPPFDFFTSSATSFHPRPYQPNLSTVPPPKPPPPARNNSLTHPLPPMDPTPGEPNTVFIHPPFFDFPDSHLYPDGLTYSVMATNPDWFLDPTDFISTHTSNPNAIPYPPQLEPPRGWCPAKKKDLKERGAEGWPDGEEPRLRCTFCRRTYAGVNAKSMWRRHVFEKHKIAMSNRRENVERSKKDAKGSQEKENLSVSKRGGSVDEPQATKSRLRSLRPAASASISALSDRKNDNDSDLDDDIPVPSAPRLPQGEFPVLEPALDLSQSTLSRSDSRGSPTPPPISPRSITPEIIGSAPRQASPSPPRPCMIMREQASPSGAVSAPLAIDVSPVIIAPRDGKSSSFNTPGVVILGKKDLGRSTAKPTPRRLFLSGSLPTPVTERLSLDRPRPTEESPLPLIRFGGRRTPRGPKTAMFAYARTKMSGARIASPTSVSEDPFGNLHGTTGDSVKPFSGRMVPTPLSSPNADSPVVRTRSYTSNDNPVKSTLNRELFSRDQTIGLGLLEAFSLKQGVVDVEDDSEIDSMLMSSPVLRARSTLKDLELDLADRDSEYQNSPSLDPPVRKRRKTNGGEV
ncbi:hypothetical protein EDB85DRAFT_1937480 [Lactarius pseudohatsudake]|nr:hypothetical protein EDB85DRAFT_1937480 [Lactarius pseudohatsudake]